MKKLFYFVLIFLIFASIAHSEPMTWQGMNWICTPVITPPTPPTSQLCTSYSYSPWSPAVCNETRIQTRTITGYFPQGCSGYDASNAPQIQQTCVYNPPTTNCLTNYSNGVSRTTVTVPAGVTQCWAFNVPAGRPAISIQIVGATLDTNATFTWQFPDGRMMPPFPPAIPGVGTYSLLGPGNASVGIVIRSQATYSANIPDIYIPAGQHIMTITGPLDGFMGITF